MRLGSAEASRFACSMAEEPALKFLGFVAALLRFCEPTCQKLHESLLFAYFSLSLSLSLSLFFVGR